MSMPRKICCTVEAITDHGGQVYSLDLIPQTPVPPFRPGQFLHLAIDEYDPSSFWPESRVFSIASSPQDRNRLRICYSVKGKFTARMEATLKIGSTVWAKLPYGDFFIDETADAVLVAGGTGISAFTAFVEAIQPDNPRRITLVYGARTPALFLFADMILAQVERIANCHAIFFAEQPDPVFDVALAELDKAPRCFPGRISLDVLWQEIPMPADKIWYLSGPPIMLNTLTAALKSRGVPAERVRTDAWE